MAVGCATPDNPARTATVVREGDTPERLLSKDLGSRPDSAKLARSPHTFDTDEEAQPDTLPTLAFGMTVETIRDGDRLFHGKGGCVNCHGSEAQGLPARGKTLTAGLAFVPAGDWNALDSVINVGMPDAQTRSPIAMPARGQHGNLNAAETRTIAAYVWAISQTRGEPWPGGHTAHAPHDWRASARTSIP
ncbi:MAG: c-type cytochrome [Gemmatimonadaceae bacterium]